MEQENKTVAFTAVEKRRFLGIFPPKSTFDKKHLNSYLKGYTHFTFGRNKYRESLTHIVKQEYYSVAPDNVVESIKNEE